MEPVFFVPNLYSSIYLNGFQYVKVPSGWSFPEHTHNLFEFIYCAVGKMEQWINGHPYILNQGDAILVKMGLPHHTRPTERASEFFVFHFNIDVPDIQSILQIVPDPYIPEHQENSTHIIVHQWVKQFITEYKDLLILYTDPTKGTQNWRLSESIQLLRMQMEVVNFICCLAESYKQMTEDTIQSNTSPSQLKLALQIAYQLELHARDSIQIGELAKTLGINRSYLSSSFKQVYGFSPMEFYMRMKIRLAKQLLQFTEYSIEEIASELNFSSPAHFSTFFRNREGISPSQFCNKQSK